MRKAAGNGSLSVLPGSRVSLTATTGLDEEQLWLPSQARAASSIEDVHNFLDGHGTSICAIDGTRELQVAGLEDKAPWLQKQDSGRNPEASPKALCG